MCGITGWIGWEKDLTHQRTVLSAMTESLAHRGPDAPGDWVTERVALGHRRLVVIDPEGGSQPMTRMNGDRTYTLVYNGELYNTAELRRELQERGHRFNSHSDTEVLLVSYIEWKEGCVERLNGIFAFGVWTEPDQKLFLARDRLGVKPLFYSESGRMFLFGSEPKSILVHPAIRPEVDAEGLAEVFVIGPARTPGHGVYRGISELKPGYSLVYDRNGLQIRQYWGLKSQPHIDDLDATVSKVRELLEDAAERQLVSDVPICTLLSGGLDSSALTAFAARSYAKSGMGPLDTYSVDYVDNDLHFRPNAFQPNSDAPWIRRVSDEFGTRHHFITFDTPELVESLKIAVRARDLPGMADVDSSLYLFCREIKKGATVALSGEAADEVFGGYPWFHREDALNARTFPWSLAIQERIRFLSPELVKAIRPEEYLADRYSQALAEVPRLPGEDAEQARMREMSYLNITRFMPTLLDRKDRMSMAVGLEVRVPYCDHRLVEYVFNIPWEMKSCDGREKGLLRRALQGVLPDDVIGRPKSPYPKSHNPTYLQAVREWALNIVDDPSSPLRPLINVPAICELARSDSSTFNLPWFGQLMNAAQFFAYLIQVDTWLREYKVEIRV